MFPSVCIAVLNWKGMRYLEELLPSLIRAESHYEGQCQIIILDNNEDDDTDRKWIDKYYPQQIKVVRAPSNDFLYSYNWLLNKIKAEIVILLNNDLRVDKKFIPPLIKHFLSENVFSVSALSYDWQGKNITSGPYLFHQHHGWVYFTPDVSRQVTCYTLFSCGGFMAVDRKKFLALGGFNRLFYPAYGEDLDICYRAWCKGWSSIYEPESIVYHFQSGSWNENKDNKAQLLTIKSNFLFQWLHLRFYPFKLINRVYLFWLYLRKFLQKDKVWLEAYRQANKTWSDYKKEYCSQENSEYKSSKSISISSLKKICASKINEIDLNQEINYL